MLVSCKDKHGFIYRARFCGFGRLLTTLTKGAQSTEKRVHRTVTTQQQVRAETGEYNEILWKSGIRKREEKKSETKAVRTNSGRAREGTHKTILRRGEKAAQNGSGKRTKGSGRGKIGERQRPRRFWSDGRSVGASSYNYP